MLLFNAGAKELPAGFLSSRPSRHYEFISVRCMRELDAAAGNPAVCSTIKGASGR